MSRLPALLLGLTLAALPLAAQAVESAPARSPRATVTLAADVAAVAPGEAFRLGLRLRLAEGWHTYWRNAGDAGAPPEVTLTLPEGVSAGAIQWPIPDRIPYGPLVNYGYKNEVLLPLPVSLPAGFTGDSLALRAEASWLVCADVCIPEEGVFTLTIPVAPRAVPSPIAAPWFEAAEARLARPSPWQARAGAGGGRASLTLAGAGIGPAAVKDALFFPAEPGLLDNTAPQAVTVRDGSLTIGLTLAQGVATPGSIDGTVVLRDGGGQRAGFDVSTGVGGPPEAAGGLALWHAMLLALAGGLILNLMPCVFPVLAMKAIGLARLSGGAAREVRLHAASYTAGVLVCFALVGGALIALRAGGSAAGWGFQFTEPAFVAVMAWLMLAVGLNLSGVFAMGATVGAGQSVAGRGGHLGAFATGGLAVLLATPCTAPFMAAALGAALVMPPAGTMAVFLALGLGLALPYALLGVFPGLARRLPRPGPWMERLRQGLAFPMYGASAWLVWVLAQQAGPDGVLFGLGGAVVLAAGLWGLGLAQQAGAPRGRVAGAIGMGLAVIVAVALLPRLSAAPAAAAAADPGAEPWSAARVEALRAEGRPVFVNATAAWCITCQVNERVALRASAVRDAFAARGVAYLKADWTRGDPAITALLRDQGRDGVPLYLFWAPGAAAPVVLPQILTEGVVLEALGGGA
ncbi:protein-disulfide reductase DsbD family protein [Falsiroseomonas stagni]|uniref:Thiol:disulfide interchange protein DsbD n=1 Tax=Falsiroseomonas stagni DSM 19981 TaxID=1123062 RepID=A0A1I3Y132_9PROT|nr:protein-disulfide reductase DsbD domain-containing protein [Falsiroseomonas stagni]SFK25462.1 thiol:disulfide interchange protein DsbD [Falsiroseomonas stagni DSM 19981]